MPVKFVERKNFMDGVIDRLGFLTRGKFVHFIVIGGIADGLGTEGIGGEV